MSQTYVPKGPVGRFVHHLEETIIAVLLGLMTLITFVNVVLRYSSGTGIRVWVEGALGTAWPNSLLWGQELVLILFAWLVLFGISYAFKVNSHLGVDALVNLVSNPVKRVFLLLTTLICIAYGGLMMKGAWDYWAPFAGLQRTEGRWFPTGFDENTRSNAFYETEQVPIPFGEAWLERTFNSWDDNGTIVVDDYEKLPRFIPYAMLPFAMALLLYRLFQAAGRVWRGTQDSFIVSHEAEEAVEQVAALNRDDAAARPTVGEER